jgi:hypothetical protein
VKDVIDGDIVPEVGGTTKKHCPIIEISLLVKVLAVVLFL